MIIVVSVEADLLVRTETGVAGHRLAAIEGPVLIHGAAAVGPPLCPAIFQKLNG